MRQSLRMFVNTVKNRQRKRQANRRHAIEQLERRDLLTAAIWHNSVFPLDVTGDQPARVSAIDALQVINWLNDPSLPRELPRQAEQATSGPFVDTNCDGRVSAFDALLVINHINLIGPGVVGGFSTDGGSYASAACSPQLLEGSAFVTELTRNLVVPRENSALEVSFEAPEFDTQSLQQIRDAFEIQIVDLDGNPISPAHRSNAVSVLNWTEGFEPSSGRETSLSIRPAGEISTATIDISHLPIDTEFVVSARLVNNDSDGGSSVIIRGFEFVDLPEQSTSQPILGGLPSQSVSAFDLASLSDVSGNVQASYGRTTLSGHDDQLSTELSVANVGSRAIMAPLLVVLDHFSELDSHAFRPDGLLPDGRPFFDLSSQLDGGVLPPGEMVSSREIRFLNQSGQRFSFSLQTFGHLNAEPSGFASSPLTTIEAGRNYRYQARAIDPEDQPLSYSKVSGPEAMRVDQTTGLVSWATTTDFLGSHRVTLRATDPYGLFVEQSFNIEVVESLQNRPPVFVSEPITEATASSGFEITTVATGARPAGVDVISGFRGPRLVSINAGNQTISMHAGQNNDRFDDLTTISTGFPAAVGQLFDVGYSVDIGLPEFIGNSDTNSVYGLDQGDINGDGILDLVVLYSYDQPSLGDRYQVRIATMFGNGDGGFSEPQIIYQHSVGSNLFSVQNLMLRDLNNDGSLDVIAVERERDPRLITLLNQGDGTFAEPIEQRFASSLSDFRIADIDEDGVLDLFGRTAVLGFGASYNAVWLKGLGDGTFNEPTIIASAGGGPNCCARPYDVLDLNGDGHLDFALFTGGSFTADFQIYHSDGTGNFTLSATLNPATTFAYNWIRGGDFNGDGFPDLVFHSSWEGTLVTLLGDGSGVNFTKVESPDADAWLANYAGSDDPIDINGNGHLDLILGHSNNDSTSPKVAINDGTGKFTLVEYAMVDFSGEINPFATGDIARGAMFGDYNGDGVLDFSYFTSGNDFNGVGIRLGTRPGEFGSTRAAPLPGTAPIGDALPGDFNGDGIIDLLDTATDTIALGNGDGTFAAPFPAVGIARPGGYGSVADFNLDGLDDVVATRANTRGSRYYVALASGDGTFTVSDEQLVEGSFYGYSSTLIADFNGDGYPDFMAKTGTERQIDVHINDPENPGVFTRTFRHTLPAGSQGINVSNWDQSYAAADVTGDGIVDLIFAERDETTDNVIKIIVMAGDGTGNFSRYSELLLHPDAQSLGIHLGFFAPGDFSTGDLNGDGSIDLIVNTSTAGARVFLNDGTGNFIFTSQLTSPGTQQRGRDSWIVDFDQDGVLDFIQTGTGGGPLIVRLGKGDGTFAAPQQIGVIAGVPGNISRNPFADIDGDGHLDFVHASGGIGNYGTNTIAVYAGRRDDLVDLIAVDLNGDGNEEILAVQEQMDRLQLFVGDNLGGLTRLPDLLTGRAPRAVAAADLNGDGQLELLTVNRASRSVSVFSGTVSSGYTSTEFIVGGEGSPATGPIDIEVADIDGDGNMDVVVLDDQNEALWVFLGNGTTTLDAPTAIALGETPSRFVLADATGDGQLDAVITLAGSNRLMILPLIGAQSIGTPFYLELTGKPSDVAVLDLNSDGKPDLAITLENQNVLSVYYGLGNNQFTRPQQIAVGASPTRVVKTDADQDGRLDLVVVNSGDDTVSVIYNRFDPNEVYRYGSEAIDPDDDPITYSIIDGPGGLIMNSETGELLWAASPDQVGVHEVTIAADDGRGGVATQSFKIAVEPARENSAPIIASRPAEQIGANDSFNYTVHAIDADNHPLRFSLVDGPEGASIHPTTGELIWDGRASAMSIGIAGRYGGIDVPYRPSLKPESITVEGWFELTGLPRFNALITDQVYVGVHETNQSFIADITLTDGERLRFFVPIRPKADQWYHIALTYDAAIGQANLFVDGQLGGSATASEPKPLNTTAGVTRVGPRGHVTQARVDNYRIWNYARSQAEIAEGLTRQYQGDPGLVLDFRFFDQPSTLSVQDHSIYGNTGYLVSNGGLPQPTVGLTTTGSYDFVVRVEDGRGGSDTQAFTLNVVPELRGRIAGYLFDDLNGNGVQDDGSEQGVPAEPNLEGWHLFIDLNGNGYPDPQEPQALTDVDGKYRFEGLLPGDYAVRVSPVAGYETPAEFTAAVVPETQAELDPLSAAIHDLAVEQLGLSQIRGQLKTENGDAVAYWKAYADLNDNGTRDEGEPLAMTDRWGNYAISGLAEGTYKVRTERPAGWTDDTDREGLTVTLAADEIAEGNDFVLSPSNSSVTGGVHFVSTPTTDIESRQTFTYASVAVGLFDDLIQYDLSLAPDGMTIDPATGLVAWRPTIGQVGEHLVILRATSASGSIALQDFYINVAAPNTAPAFAGVVVHQPQKVSTQFPTAFVGRTYAVDLIAQDADGHAITFGLVDFPGTATLNATTGALRWLPEAIEVGIADFTILLTDSMGATSTASFSIEVLNQQPNSSPFQIVLPRTVIGLGQDYLGQVAGLDALGRPLSWSLQSGPDSMTVSSTGTLRWSPGNSDLGSHLVVLQATDVDGAIETTSFDLQVVGRPVNSAPQITSTPLTSTVIGGEYRYNVQFEDRDSDVVAFALLESPAGMSIHPSLGTVRWMPVADQLGESTVTVQVADPDGRTDTQTYKLNVSRFGGPPRISSIPPTEAAIGTGYLYSVLARDAEGDPLTYRLLAAPAGMTITPTTGEIVWTPAPEQLGSQDVVIEVSDGVGGAVTQAFAIRVRDGLPNLPPVITSSAPRLAVVGAAYEYNLIATDPEGTLLSYSLGQAPEGLTIDSETGQVRWTPAAGQAGQFVVTLIVTDEGGASAVESFELDVLAENSPPVISSTAPGEVMSGVVFTYQVLASDADLDPLTHTLTAAPAGATIDAFGKITWPTTGQDLGDHEFEVEVSDPRGGVATQRFTLSVVADTEPPKLSLIERPNDGSRNILPWQGPFVVYVRAIDNVGIASLTLTANGRDIPLDAAGTAIFTFEEWTFQRINATATAVDTSGNVTTRTISFDYDFPEGWSGAGTEDIPTAIISSPTDTQTVFGIVSITGTAAHENFAAYKLSYRRVDETSYTEFLQSDTPVTNGQLGVWDTSLLINDEYVIRLEVATNTGIVNVVEHNVGLAGELKLGNFRLSFTDMVIPVAGIPIEITRIYDTLQADRQGDFGYGWRLEYRDTDLRVGLPKSGLEDIGIFPALRPGVKVFLNVPGEGRQGFTFDPDIRVLPGFGGNNLVLARPRFRPDPGVTSTLGTGTSGYLQVNELGELYAPGGIPYNPASPDFGGAYVLTTREGITYRIDGASGELMTATDRSGNKLEFTESGISADGSVLVTIQRAAGGRITRIQNTAGNAVHYEYQAGNLSKALDPEGNATTFSYDSRGRLDQVTDPLNRAVASSTYDASGRLLSVTDGNGRTVSYPVSGDTTQQVIEDADGSVTVLEFDDKGQIVSEADPLGGVTRREFDAHGRVTVEIDPSGARVQNRYDASGNLVSQTNRNGDIVRLSYDARGLPLSLTTASGVTTRFEYNDAGLLTARLSDDGEVLEAIEYDQRGNPLRMTDANGNVETLEYNSQGIATANVDALGRRVELGLNEAGQATSRTDARGNTLQLTRDRRGLVTAIVGQDGKSVTRRFNSASELNGLTLPSGSQTSFAVDALGNETLLQDANGASQVRIYDLTGNLTSLKDESGNITRYEYDTLGRRTGTIYPDGATESFAYDAVGNLILSTDARGNDTRFAYDGERRLLSAVDALGRRTLYRYDAEGRTTEIRGPDSSTVRYEYDSAGNRVRTHLPDGKIISTEFDAVGNPLSETDTAGGTVRLSYDAASQLTSVTAADGGVTRFTYDANGNLILQTDSLGNVTTFEYDSYNRLTAKVYPGGDRESYTYDQDGWLTSTVDGNGQETITQFDGNGNVLARQFADGTQESFTYSPTNRVLTATNRLGQVEMRYDNRDRLIAVVNPDGSAVRYEYDAHGNRTSVTAVDTAGNTRTTNYAFDQLNRLWSVSDADGRQTLYEYDLASRVSSVLYPSGLRTTYSYTQAGFLQTIETSRDSVVVERVDYTFGDSHERLSAEWSDGRTTQFTYDASLRLTSESQYATNGDLYFQETYAYDLAGNRTSVTDAQGSEKLLTYNANNQIVMMGDRSYVYDGQGRLVEESSGSDRITYVYDAEGQLIEVDSNGSKVEYQYDALGNRIAEFRGGLRTNLLLDYHPSGLEQVLAEYSPGEAFSVEYVYGHKRVSRQDAAGTAYYHHDASQNVVALSDEGGEWTDRYTSTAFGELLQHNGLSSNVYVFASERVDADNGLVHLRARDYSPEQGRFLTRDPFSGVLTDPTSLHRYQYGHSNPISNTDPTGEVTLSEQAIVGAVIGGLSSGISAYLGGKRGKELVFETFVGAAFGAVGGQFGGALSKAFATQFTQSRIFATLISNPTVIKYSPRLVHAIPNTVLGISEDLTKGFGTGSYRDPGFASSVAFNAGANFFFNILVGPGFIGDVEIQRAVPTGRRLGASGSATYEIFSRAAREEAAPHFRQMVLFFGDSNFTRKQELFLQFLNDTTKFLVSQVISIHASNE
jgi:large repetitive protein